LQLPQQSATDVFLAKSNDITVTYDGENISFDVQPEIVDDRVMVPMRTIFETFGARLNGTATRRR